MLPGKILERRWGCKHEQERARERRIKWEMKRQRTKTQRPQTGAGFEIAMVCGVEDVLVQDEAFSTSGYSDDQELYFSSPLVGSFWGRESIEKW